MIAKTIIIYLTASLSLITFIDNNTSKRLLTHSDQTIRIEFLEPEELIIPLSLDMELIVRITNLSLEDVYIPKIQTPLDKHISLPTFYSLTTTPQDDCSAEFLRVRKRKRELDSFIQIPRNSSKEMIYNPHHHEPSLWCGYKKGEKIKISLTFDPKPEYFEDKYLEKGYSYISDTIKLKEIYSKIPRDTFRSQELELTIQ